jgi:hypothetical protein
MEKNFCPECGFTKDLCVCGEGNEDRRLPEGWRWSYVLPAITEKGGKVTKPSACAVRYRGKTKKGVRYEYSMDPKGTPITVDLGLFNEVFARGETEKEAMRKVVKYIKTHKNFKRRWIHFP